MMRRRHWYVVGGRSGTRRDFSLEAFGDRSQRNVCETARVLVPRQLTTANGPCADWNYFVSAVIGSGLLLCLLGFVMARPVVMRLTRASGANLASPAPEASRAP